MVAAAHVHGHRAQRRVARSLPIPRAAHDFAPLGPIVEADRGGVDGEQCATLRHEVAQRAASIHGEGERPGVAVCGVALGVHAPAQHVDGHHGEGATRERSDPFLQVLGDRRAHPGIRENCAERRSGLVEGVRDAAGEEQVFDGYGRPAVRAAHRAVPPNTTG